jgi:lysophospholipase L1-like esterase
MLPKSPGARVVLVVLSLFAASEIALRILTDMNSRWYIRMGANKVFDPVVHFRNKPNSDYGRGISTNEYGYQAPRNLQHARPANAIRIIYVGDSNSVMPMFAPFPLQVERLVEGALGIDVETVNTAVPGHSSENSRLLFEHEVSLFDADYCFIYLGWNDLGQFGPEGLPYKRQSAGYRISPLQRALSEIYTGRFVYAAQQVLRRYQTTINEQMTAEERPLYEEYRPDHFYENMHAILQLAKSRYPRVYVMNLATITNEDPNEFELRTAHFPSGMNKNMTKLHYLVGKYNVAVEAVAEEEGVPLIDLYHLFDSHEARRDFTDSAHLNSDGAGRIARTLAEAILATEASAPSLPREPARTATR